MFGEKVYSMVKNILSNLRLCPKGGNVSPTRTPEKEITEKK